MLYQRNDSITLADLLAFCEFATQDSIAFGLHTSDERRTPIGWIDSHVTYNHDREPEKVHFRLCIDTPYSTLNRINSLRSDLLFALGLPAAVYFEMTVFNINRSVLLCDERDCIISTTSASIDLETPILDLDCWTRKPPTNTPMDRSGGSAAS